MISTKELVIDLVLLYLHSVHLLVAPVEPLEKDTLITSKREEMLFQSTDIANEKLTGVGACSLLKLV